MKTLFLTSAGFINQEISRAFLTELSKPVENTEVLVVAYAQNSQEEFYVNESKEELKNLGFKDITVVNMHHAVDVKDLANFDAIYVCGGNTFAILNKLRETGLDAFIISQVNSGAIYVGVSAGSIIAGPDIEIAGWGSEGDKNEIGLRDLTGLNFTNIAVFPHFHEELRVEVKEFRAKVKYEVIELTNDQAVFVKDSAAKIIGSFFPFKSFSEDEFKIVEVKPCTKKFLFHSSGKKLEKLDPKYNRKLEAYGSVHEYGVPVVYASDMPSNAFCYEPTEIYAKAREQHGTSVYHRLVHDKHRILLGANLKGYIYVLSGADFFEVTRDDFEMGKWIRSVEWVSPHEVVPIEAIEITKPYDWEMIPEYEFLGTGHVGEMDAMEYLALAKDESVKKAVQSCINEPFIPFVPDALKKYIAND
jgi:dipeptidase E